MPRLDPVWGVEGTYAPRRTVLDRILLDPAVEQGVEFREHFTVSDLARASGVVSGNPRQRAWGPEVTERAAIVIGADGRNSTVSRLVDAGFYPGPTPPPTAASTPRTRRGAGGRRRLLQAPDHRTRRPRSFYDATREVLATAQGPDRGTAAFGRLRKLSLAWSRRVDGIRRYPATAPA